jgi:hypothetical protein
LFTIIAATIGAHSQTLPAMPPTTTQPGQTTPGQATPDAPAVVTPPPNPPHRAEVLFANGQLQVRADNSSLNQILRSISHLTGLKVTGGVEEERVFGNYGPGPLPTVLATLIDGTGANIFLLGGNATTPPELILTSRSGGAEPPSPTSPTYAMYDDTNDHNAPVAPHNAIAPTQPPSPATSGSGSVSPAVPPANVPPPAGTTPPPAPPSAAAAPGTLTPEMVEQELLQMQAQQDLKKKQLDEKTRQQQIDQQKKLQNVKPQPAPSQPPPNQNPPSQPPPNQNPPSQPPPNQNPPSQNPPN